jgi:hypothetical protein
MQFGDDHCGTWRTVLRQQTSHFLVSCPFLNQLDLVHIGERYETEDEKLKKQEEKTDKVFFSS